MTGVAVKGLVHKLLKVREVWEHFENKSLEFLQTQPRYFIYKKATCFGPRDNRQAIITKTKNLV
jgi:hypothetical protein